MEKSVTAMTCIKDGFKPLLQLIIKQESETPFYSLPSPIDFLSEVSNISDHWSKVWNKELISSLSISFLVSDNLQYEVK